MLDTNIKRIEEWLEERPTSFAPKRTDINWVGPGKYRVDIWGTDHRPNVKYVKPICIRKSYYLSVNLETKEITDETIPVKRLEEKKF